MTNAAFFRRNILVILLLLLFLTGISSCNPAEGNPETPTPRATNLPTPTSASLPDIIVNDVRLDISPEAFCNREAISYRVLVQIKNQGNGDAGPFSVTINEDPSTDIPSLAAQESLDLWIDSDTLNISVFVDPQSEVPETNESNNFVTIELTSPLDQSICAGVENNHSQIIESEFSLDAHTGKVLSVNFSPDGNLIASGSVDNTLRLWQATPGNLLRTMRGHPFPVLAVKFSLNGAYLATGSTDGIVRIWRVSDGRLFQELKGHAGRVKSLDFSSDGRFLISCADDFTIRLWRMIDFRLSQTIDEGMSDITSVAFAPDSLSFAWSEITGTIRVRSISGNWLHVINETPLPANAIAFDPLGEWLSAGYNDGGIRLWDSTSGETLQILKTHAKAINDLEFSPDGRWLASASQDGTIHLFQRGEKGFSSTPTLILSGHRASVNSISFSPDGKRLASASDDYSIRVWEIPQEE